MVNVVMHGCNGKMGQVISEIVAKDKDLNMIAGVDKFDDGHNPYPVFSDIFQQLPPWTDSLITVKRKVHP